MTLLPESYWKRAVRRSPRWIPTPRRCVRRCPRTQRLRRSASLRRPPSDGSRAECVVGRSPWGRPQGGSDGRGAARLQELDDLGSRPAHTAPEGDSDWEARLVDHPPRGRPTDATVELDVADVPVLRRPQVNDRIVLTGAHAEEMRLHARLDAKCRT